MDKEEIELIRRFTKKLKDILALDPWWVREKLGDFVKELEAYLAKQDVSPAMNSEGEATPNHS